MNIENAYAAAKKYAPDRNDLQDAFIAGIQYATTGKYYKRVDIFESSGIPTFDDWWDEYQKKCERKKTEAKWKKLTASQKIACMKATPAYVRATPDKTYRKNPLTYLNGECWNDEIILKQNGESKRTQQLAEKAARILNTE